MWHNGIITQSENFNGLIISRACQACVYFSVVQYDSVGWEIPQSFSYSYHMKHIWLRTEHYSDVIMGTTASQITSLTIVFSTVYSDADQRKHQSSASLAFVRESHRGPMNFPHTGNGQLRGKCFHLMTSSCKFRLVHWLCFIPKTFSGNSEIWVIPLFG